MHMNHKEMNGQVFMYKYIANHVMLTKVNQKTEFVKSVIF